MSNNPSSTFDPVPLARQLLRAIESRGRDATGAAWTDPEGVWWDKSGVRASSYVNRLPMSPLATTAILHTRMATSGSPKDNSNNHPHTIAGSTAGVTGVHNGIVTNDLELFDLVEVEPLSLCDSEAIFALLANRDRIGFSITDCLSVIEGDASVAWIETEQPDVLHLARVQGRPLALGRTPKGSLLFASTDELLRKACKAASVQLSRVWNLTEGTYVSVTGGRVVDFQMFDPAPKPKPVYRFLPSSLRDDWDWDDPRWDDRSFDRKVTDPRDLVPQGLGLGQVRELPKAKPVFDPVPKRQPITSSGKRQPRKGRS